MSTTHNPFSAPAAAQAELNRARKVKLHIPSAGRFMPDQTDVRDGILTNPNPDLALSPRTPTGLRTTQFQFMIIPLTSPFTGATITFWEREPETGLYGVFESITGVATFQWWVCDDVNACEFFVEISGIGEDSDLMFCWVEQGFCP